MKYFRYKKKPLQIYMSIPMFTTENYETLDITAGLRKFWRNKPHKNVLFLDIRKEVKPDIVADNEHLPFKNETFNMIFYDPPYLIRKNESIMKTELGFRYGFYNTKSQLIKNIYNVNKEAARVLKPKGKLLLKYTPTPENLTLDSVLKLLNNFKEIQRTWHYTKTHHSKNKTYLILLEKI